jgi:hypothetical protein
VRRSQAFLIPVVIPALLLLIGALSAPATLADDAPSGDGPAVDAVQPTPDPAYLQELLATTRAQRLSQRRYWHLLMHYRKGLTGTFSEAVWKDFFLAANGKRDPRAELEATLAAMFAEEPANPDDHAQCRFPARWGWLKEVLEIDSSRLPDRPCTAYQNWRNTLQLESVSVVFASSYLGNPSSMYGHTFLLLHRRGNENPLLDPSLNFAADVTTSNSLLYLLYGLVGVFPGRFSAMPYYDKIQQYNNLENRDLWEYRLAFDAPAIERFQRHIWEMEHLYFRYYFFNKNCSYQLLPMLEVADPRLRLTEHWPLYVVPADTIRTLLAQPGLVLDKLYRPSHFTQMVANRKALGPEELGLVEGLARPPADAELERVQSLPPENQVRVLDSASEYLEYRIDYRRNPPAGLLEQQRKINVARGRLDLPSSPASVVQGAAPELGHDTRRLTLTYGEGATAFQGAALRLSLHDLLDRGLGYRPNSTLEMGQIELRRDAGTRNIHLESLDLVRLVSLSPRDRWSHRRSFKFSVGFERARELEPAREAPLYFRLNLGIGPSAQAHVVGRELFYAMAELDSGIAGAFASNTRLGGGATGGMLVEPTSWWRLQGEVSFLDYVVGDHRGQRRFSMEQSLNPLKNVALRARWERRGDDTQKSISIQRYF